MVAQALASLEAPSPLLWRVSDTIGTIDCPPKQSSPKKRKKRASSGSIDVVVAASLVTSEEATPLLLLALQVSCVQSLEPRDPCNSKYLLLGHT